MAMGALLLACPPPGGEYGTLAGTVRNHDGAAQAGVLVSTIPQTSIATTDAAGYFCLERIHVGTYLVNAEGAGQVPLSRETAVVEGETTRVNVTLAPTAPPLPQAPR
jgi:hypothetical protein